MNTHGNKIFYLKNIANSIKSQDTEDSVDDIYRSIENARKEWEDAKNIFENVTNPDLIDYAIHKVDATEKRYTYLLKQIKSGNIY
ncbi:protein subunit release factor A [Sedimentibacter acidaminivorans]|jgi:protein subunit release factor A|uniref:Protein subunit release factor A n=1 Tax=Sedimentibacter acidaminivorans TaxID=913099 RepID=A0ABS4GFW4_9FIRM|nr:YaaL family protein [Sedimentibacter acidaminivorans]MBP1926537.1 protein subunit release factor A [Sedimentibacter acidaminivorans]